MEKVPPSGKPSARVIPSTSLPSSETTPGEAGVKLIGTMTENRAEAVVPIVELKTTVTVANPEEVAPIKLMTPVVELIEKAPPVLVVTGDNKLKAPGVGDPMAVEIPTPESKSSTITGVVPVENERLTSPEFGVPPPVPVGGAFTEVLVEVSKKD